tara:strand:+ start:506 stop:1048 length:543 start_codon:yes stop_codon:yes gene_type:complete
MSKGTWYVAAFAGISIAIVIISLFLETIIINKDIYPKLHSATVYIQYAGSYFTALCLFALMIFIPSEIVTKAMVFAAGAAIINWLIPLFIPAPPAFFLLLTEMGNPLIAGAAGSLIALESQKHVTDPPVTPERSELPVYWNRKIDRLRSEIAQLQRSNRSFCILLNIMLIVNISVLLFKL